MLQIQLLRENPEEVITRLKVKNFDATELVQNILELDTQLRQMKKNLDNNLMEQGKIAKSIGQMFKEGRREEAEQMKAQTAELKVQEKELQAELDEKGQKINEMMVLLPNMPHASVPLGKGTEDNEVVYQEGDATPLGLRVRPQMVEGQPQQAS